MITGLYTGLFGLFLLYHLYTVIRLRFKHEVSLGSGGHDELNYAVRAHGNFVEMVPIFLIILFLNEIQGMPILFLHIMGAGFCIGRLLHNFGIKRPGSSQWFTRRAGTILSCLIIAVGALSLIKLSIF